MDLADGGGAAQMGATVLHLIKLSVGPKDVAELRQIQARRLAEQPPLRHWTRMIPRRGGELLAGGSIYWVVAGFVRVRQRLIGLEEGQTADGRAQVGLVLDPELVPVEMRPQKPFQGWRYLQPEAAPADLPADGPVAEGLDALPPRLRRELRELGLI
ncbi:DUF1489 family protein [Roseomonas gilardii]|uniref:DUF1489 family protein n=1 Tax=Roseomonas gilardii TaxID=257708 RepID=UPI0021B65376|nr:DUF1489 domain-containing protein [Roseomonas gilardii]